MVEFGRYAIFCSLTHGLSYIRNKQIVELQVTNNKEDEPDIFRNMSQSVPPPANRPRTYVCRV